MFLAQKLVRMYSVGTFFDPGPGVYSDFGLRDLLGRVGQTVPKNRPLSYSPKFLPARRS